MLNSKKCAIYIRVSTHYQIDKDSLPLQREDLINYAKYVIDTDKYEVFEDAGYSGKNIYRPAYQQMMSRMRTGEFSHLLVWKIDRISRNLLDFASMYAELKKLGVTFVSKNEQFDTSSAMGEAMLKIILVFAELERNMTSERVTAVMLSRASGGQWNGGRVPYGYDYDKESKTFSINESEASNILKMYDAYLNGSSFLDITKEFNANGIKTKSGSNWTPTTVCKILTSRFYLGEYQYNLHKDGMGGAPAYLKPEKEWITITDHHPAIINEEQWERCAAIRSSKHRNGLTQETYQRKNTHIFAGIIKCGKCGGNYQATIDKPRAGGYRPSIYLCANRRRLLECDNKCVSDITIGPFVLNYIANMLKASNNIGRSTPLDVFQKKLLRGSVFEGVKAIDEAGLVDMYDMMVYRRFSENLFKPPKRESDDDKIAATEKELLITEKRKYERAINRLKSIYLYGEDAISETEYITESKNMLDNIDRIDKRLLEIDKTIGETFSISDEEFLEKASYFIISQELTKKRHVNFDRIVKHIDTNILKKFINSVIQKIVVFDGKITEIHFKNGITHKFLY